MGAFLMAQYPKARLIITIDPEEINHWRPMGFAVATPAPWLPADHRLFLEQWGKRWQEIVVSDRKTAEKADPALLVGWLSRQTLGFSPLDVTLRAWAAFSGDLQGTTAASDQQAYVARHLPPAAEEAMAQVCADDDRGEYFRPHPQAGGNAPWRWPGRTPSNPCRRWRSFSTRWSTAVCCASGPSGRVSFGHMLIAARLSPLALEKEENLPSFLRQLPRCRWRSFLPSRWPRRATFRRSFRPG